MEPYDAGHAMLLERDKDGMREGPQDLHCRRSYGCVRVHEPHGRDALGLLSCLDPIDRIDARRFARRLELAEVDEK